jgi:DNA ligase-1
MSEGLKFIQLCTLMDTIRKTQGDSAKKAKLVNFFKSGVAQAVELEWCAQFLTGTVFPQGKEEKLNLAEKQIATAIADYYLLNEDDLQRQYEALGSYSKVVAELHKNDRASDLLTVNDVACIFIAISKIEGDRAYSERTRAVTNALGRMNPIEAEFFIALILEQMPTGYNVGTKAVLAAIAEAYGFTKPYVQEKYALCGDIGFVAHMASCGKKAMEEITISLGIPIKPMLAEAMKYEDAIAIVENGVQADYKLDGVRCQAHVSESILANGDSEGCIQLFSRGLEDMTEQFPEIAKALHESLIGRTVIFDGEIIAVNADGSPLPFGKIQERLRRKKNIEQAVKDIKVCYNIFDILYLDGKDLRNLPLSERMAYLSEVCAFASTSSPYISIVRSRFIDNEIDLDDFFNEALAMGHEGIILKSLDEPYLMDKREWIKIKRIQRESAMLDTLDCVVLDYEMGTGKWAGTVGACILGVYDWAAEDKQGRQAVSFKEIGKVSCSIPDEERKLLTERLKAQKFMPEVVVEVMYEEITRTTDSFALRFPRIKCVRTDKKQPDNLGKVIKLYESQVKRA